jgi:hypothetical protein
MREEHKLHASDGVEDDAEGDPAARAPVVLGPEDLNTTE